MKNIDIFSTIIDDALESQKILDKVLTVEPIDKVMIFIKNIKYYCKLLTKYLY